MGTATGDIKDDTQIKLMFYKNHVFAEERH